MAKFTGRPSEERLRNQEQIRVTKTLSGKIGEGLGSVVKAVRNVNDTNTQSVIQAIGTSPLNKAWRVGIIHNRAVSPMPKQSEQSIRAKVDNLHYATEDSYSVAQLGNEWTSQKAMNGRDSKPVPKEFQLKERTIKQFNNEILIINRNVSPAVTLVLQNRPNDIDINPQSDWSRVKSMGRNNPFMMYTGGEDTISFEISWYAIDQVNRDDVINKCKLLESWSRANGYLASPPTLEILWGSSGLFDNQLFILESAPYKLSNFQNSERVPKYQIEGNPDTISQRDLKLLPNTATQTLTFVRVSANNRTHEDIIPMEKLKTTPGVRVDPTTNSI